MASQRLFPHDIARELKVPIAWPSDKGIVYSADGTKFGASRWVLRWPGYKFKLREGLHRREYDYSREVSRSEDREYRLVPQPETPDATGLSNFRTEDGRWRAKPFASWADLDAWLRASNLGAFEWRYYSTQKAWLAHPLPVPKSGVSKKGGVPCEVRSFGELGYNTCAAPCAPGESMCGRHVAVERRRTAASEAREVAQAERKAEAERARELCMSVSDVIGLLQAAVPFDLKLEHDGWHRDDGTPSPNCAGKIVLDVEQGRALAEFIGDLTGAGLPDYLR